MASAAPTASSAPAAAAEAPKKGKTKAVEKYEFVNTTPKGSKKDFSSEMLPAYHPQAVEASWEDYWEASGFFGCSAATAEAAGPAGRFVMVIPPPNVTGSLHLGHALTSAVEDTLTRWHRMCGRPTLWLPGIDHAGIATQAVVEKKLAKERGLSRHDLGREAFVAEVWKWKEQYGDRIQTQQRGLGISADFSRSAFTMDPQLSRAVVEAFVQLYERKLIYRDTRLVNWCAKLKTAISDIEIDYLDIEKKTYIPVPGHDPKKTYKFGVLWSFAYKVADSPTGEEIVVATTRPETMLGDTAVAVHPADPRYTHLVGKRLVHPFIPDRDLRVIADAELVDMALGTGAVKITPAHDPNDYKCGKRHGLAFITVFSEDGRMNDAGGPFAGLMRFDAREAVCKKLAELGLSRGEADNKMRLGVCSRSGDVIEPLIKPQWYVSCGEMGHAAASAVREGRLKLVPDFHASTWYHWLDNSQDWCISRQLWWGHRVPAYFVVVKGQPRADPAAGTHWVVARSEADALAQAAAAFGVPASDISLEQDPDVLDTWFSSGLFPFATMGWPNTDSPDFKGFYPNSLLETGHDILFFWVARMVMLGLTLTGQLPFTTVYLHAMVRDKYGRKMSKSLGNVIDPFEVMHGCDLAVLHAKVREGNLPEKEVKTAIEGQKVDFPDGIPECGADALRFGLLAYTIQGRDINLDINRVVSYRMFCNKLWNATRFALLNLTPGKYTHKPLLDMADEVSAAFPALPPRDQWILSRLSAAAVTVNDALAGYEFGRATSAAYDFWLYELCDYYLELIKPVMHRADAAPADPAAARAAELSRFILYTCLDRGLKLLHPFMPFVTEELWHRLPGRGAPWRADGSTPDPPSIMVAPFPAPLPGCSSAAVEATFALFQSVVRAGRGLRQQCDLLPKVTVEVFLAAEDAGVRAQLASQADDVATLMNAGSARIVAPGPGSVPDGCAAAVVDERVSVHIQLRGIVDPAKEIEKLDRKAAKVADDAAKLAKRMSVAGYETKVPEDVRATNAETAAGYEKQLAGIAALKAQYASWAAADTGAAPAAAGPVA